MVSKILAEAWSTLPEPCKISNEGVSIPIREVGMPFDGVDGAIRYAGFGVSATDDRVATLHVDERAVMRTMLV